MPDLKISALAVPTALDLLDETIIVDKSDTTMAVSGSSRKITMQQLQPWRNILDNGAQNVCQRPTSLAGIVTDTGVRTVDRIAVRNNALGTVTSSQTVDAPASTQFTVCSKMLFTTADAAPAVGDYCFFAEGVEGVNLQHLLWGTVDAKSVTFSFWIKATIAGSVVVCLYRAEATARHISAIVTINTGNVWEYKTVTFPGDQTTAVSNDFTQRLSVEIWIGSGTNWTSGVLQTAWGAVSATQRASGVTNFAATINNFVEITGLQLEVGTVATPFETRRYDLELMACQRYLYVIRTQGIVYGVGQCFSTIAGQVNVPLSVPMRVAPTLTAAGAGSDYAVWGSAGAGVALNALPTLGGYIPGALSIDVRWATAASMVAGDCTNMYNATATGSLTFSAEI